MARSNRHWKRIGGATTSSFLFRWIVGSLLSSGCSSDPSSPGEGGGENTFESLIQKAGTYENPIPSGRTEGTPGSFMQEAQPREDGTSWICREKEVSIDDAPDQFVLFRDQAFVNIYPGSMLQGSTLEADPPSRVRADRAGGTVLIQLQTGTSEPTSVTVPTVDPASINQAVNDLVAGQQEQPLPAVFSYNAVRVESTEELRLEMGLKTETFGAEVESKFRFESDTSKERWLIKLVQSFYTIQFVPPNSADGWFADGVTPADVAADIAPGNPPVYVSTVSYGRIVFLLLETEATRTEVEASIEASGAVTSGSISGTYIGNLKNASIKAVVYGGAMDINALEGSDFTAAQNALNDGQAIELGKPISYSMADVKTEHPVRVRLAETFTVRECIPFVGTTFDFRPGQSLSVMNGAQKIHVGHFSDSAFEELAYTKIVQGQTASIQPVVSLRDGGFAAFGSPLDQDISGIGVSKSTFQVADLDGDGVDGMILESQKTGTDLFLTSWPAFGLPVETYEDCWPDPYGYAGQLDAYTGNFQTPGKDALAWNLLVGNGQNIVQVGDPDLGNPICSFPGFNVPIWTWSYDWSLYTGDVGDFNNDGLDDFVWWAAHGNSQVYAWTGLSRVGLFPSLVQNPITNLPRTEKNWLARVADLDNDGRSDLLWIDAPSNGDPALIGVALADGTGHFSNPFSAGADHEYGFLGPGPFEVRFGNLDADGAPEVLLYRLESPNEIFVLKGFNAATERFGIIARIRHENPDNLSPAQWANYQLFSFDATGDGKDDLIWASLSGGLYAAVAGE